MVERPPPRLGDLHRCDLNRAPARDYALGCRCRKPGYAEIDHLLDRESVR
jgi:hypothetical protein